MYGQGKNFVYPALVIYIKKNNLAFNRIGITASTKIGGAVKRNRARRIIRAAFVDVFKDLSGYDVVFAARAKTTRCKMQDVKRCMLNALESMEK